MSNDARFTPGCIGGWSKREMARDLGRDPATISRETSRHRGQRGDRHQPADGQATARRQEASAVPRKMTPERWAVVEERLQEGWRLEPGADCRLGSVAGPRDGGEGVELPARTGGSAGRRDPVPVPATSGQAAERARRPARRTRPHSRSGGPCGPSGGGGPGLEVPVPGVGGREDRVGGDRGDYPAPGAGSGPGPHRHRRPRKVLEVRTPEEVFARGLAPPGRGPRSPLDPGTPVPLVIHRSGFARPPGPECALAWADGFGQDCPQSRWVPSVAKMSALGGEFFGRRHDLCLRATPSFRDRGDCCTSEWKRGFKITFV